MEKFFLDFLSISFLSAIMISFVLVVRKLFSKGSSKMRCYLWIIVLIRLMIPVHLSFSENFISKTVSNGNQYLAGYHYIINLYENKVVKNYFTLTDDKNTGAGNEKENGGRNNNEVNSEKDNVSNVNGKKNTDYVSNENGEKNTNNISGINGKENENGVSDENGKENENHVSDVNADKISNRNGKGNNNEENSDNVKGYVNKADGKNDNEMNTIMSGETHRKREIVRFLMALWLLGMILLLGYMVLLTMRLRRTIETAIPEKKIYLENEVKIYRDENVVSPFLFGFLKPKIYVPFHISDEDLNYVIAHEQSHIKRKDYIIKPLFYVVVAIHWFNPLVWVSYFMMCGDIELACDERVICDNSQINRAAYMSLLLKYAAGRKYRSVSPVAFGECNVKGRVKNMINYRKPKKMTMFKGAIICACLGIFFISHQETYGKVNEQSEEVISVAESEGKENMTDGNDAILTMDLLLELVESGEIDRIIKENDVDYLKSFANWNGDETKEDGTYVSPYCNVRYNGVSYTIYLDYENAEEGSIEDSGEVSEEEKIISYLGVLNEDYNEWYKIYKRNRDEYPAKDLRDFLNKSYDIDDYFQYELPEGYEIGNYDGDMSYYQKVWLLEGGDFDTIYEELWTEERRDCPGGIGWIEKEGLVFEDGILTDVDWWENHSGRTKAEQIEGLRCSAILKEYTFDLFTQAGWYEYQIKHPDADKNELGYASFWYIFMYDEENDTGYFVFLNKRYFTKEDAVRFAGSVDVIQ